MTDIITAFVQFPFLQNAFLAGFLASIGCGLIGPFVVINRISYLAGGIAHAVLGGMGAAIYYGFPPLISALITAVLSALLIAYVKLKYTQQEDTIIGSLWAVGMATGILFISKTPGYNAELISYLFGNILIVANSDLSMMLLLDLVVIAMVLIFYRTFVLISFDSEYAQTRGINVNLYYTLLLCLIAVVVVLLIQVVGLILVIALLTIPAAISSHYLFSLHKIIFLSMLLGFVFSSGGIVVSFYSDVPAGATIIILATLCFFLSTLLAKPLLKLFSVKK